MGPSAITAAFAHARVRSGRCFRRRWKKSIRRQISQGSLLAIDDFLDNRRLSIEADITGY